MKTRFLRIFLIGSLAFLPGGCDPYTAANTPVTPTHTSIQTVASPVAPTAPAVPTQEDDLPQDPSLPIPAVAGIEMLIEQAKADLSQRLSIPVTQINHLEAREVFWPDSSLGCPQSGTSYTQAVVPGYRIILESQDNQFEYHANIHGHVFYCEHPTPPILGPPATAHP